MNQINQKRLASDEIPIQYSEEPPVSSSSSRELTSGSSSRGRSFLRSPSLSDLENIDEARLSSGRVPKRSTKRARSPMKQLFGEHGWLGRSMSMNELPTEEYRKKTGFKQWGGRLKERVEHLVGSLVDTSNYPVTKLMQTPDISSLASRLQSPSKSKSMSSSKSRFHVSLPPPFQAKLYSEMELMIVATANRYLQIQQGEGRMSVDSLTRILESWASKNRPQVIEFLFDQATQRDLVLHNLRSFRFYGPRADNLLSVNSMLQNWKALAREMSVRTFCAPDPVVRKNLVDTSKVLEMLGAPLITITAFNEIRKKTELLIGEFSKARRDYEKIRFGMERRWEPQVDVTDGDTSNPFA